MTRSSDPSLIAAVGDVHGCYPAAARAVRELERLGLPAVFLGDYVDRGPSSRRTVELLIEARARHPEWIFLLGNHEAILLEAMRTGVRGMTSFPMPADEEYDQAGGLPEDHRRFMESLYPFHETESLVFLHGGVGGRDASEVNRPVGEHPVHELIWTYEISPLWKGKKLVRGHAVVPRPMEHRGFVSLDTGCCFGGFLTIALLRDVRPEGERAMQAWIEVSPDGSEVREEWG